MTYGPYRPERTTISLLCLRVDTEWLVVGLRQKLVDLLGCQLVGCDVRRKARALVAVLEVRAVAPDADDDRRAGDLDRVHGPRVDLVEAIGHEVVEPGVGPVAEVEPSEPLDSSSLTRGDAVEVVLHPRGEVVVDELLEVALQQVDDRERDERRERAPSPS